MNRIKWMLKQLLPLRYESNYGAIDKRYFATWNMWFGICFNFKNKEVK